MAGSLEAFLNPTPIENKKVVISDRFKDKDGKPVPFEIRAIDEKENNMLMKQYTKTDRKTGNEHFNRIEYGHALVAAAVVFPDLKSSELQKHYKVLGEAELLQAMLTVGEFAALSDAIDELSGLDRNDINEQMEDVKNA